MFDAHIQYYSYNNVEGDEFGVGYLGNKEFWVHLMNGWNRNDGYRHRYTIEEWDDFECMSDLRGCELAEVVPDEQGFVVTWLDGEDENSMRITHDNQIVWENNPQNIASVPRWISRLKNQLRDTEN